MDNPSGHEREIGDVLEARFGALGCKVTRDEIGNVVAVFPGRRSGTILFSTHMDTVGSDTGIKPIIGDDGVIRTDGSTILGADEKSGIAGVARAPFPAGANQSGVSDHRVRDLVREGWACRISEHRHRRAERESRIRHGHRGRDGVDHLLGTDGGGPHGDHQARGARWRGAREGDQRDKGGGRGNRSLPLGRIDEETVANIGKFTGGDASNIVPDEVLLGRGTARSLDQAKLDAQLDTMRTAFESAAAKHGANLDFSSEEVYRTYKIDEDAAPFREAAAAIGALGLEVTAQVRWRHRRQPLQRQRDTRVGLPTGMVDEHATSEHIAIDDMVIACQVMVGIVTGPPADRRTRSASR